MRDILCQNCLEKLGEKDDVKNILKFRPCEIDSMTFEIDADHTLITLSCPKCGCVVQVIS